MKTMLTTALWLGLSLSTGSALACVVEKDGSGLCRGDVTVGHMQLPTYNTAGLQSSTTLPNANINGFEVVPGIAKTSVLSLETDVKVCRKNTSGKLVKNC